jgi:hypothetical protein
MLNLKFTSTSRDSLYQVELENLPDKQVILKELGATDWKYDSLSNRHWNGNPIGSEMCNITKFMLSEQVKRTILDNLWVDIKFRHAWYLSVNDLMNSTLSGVSWVKDIPGLRTTEMHKDPRLLVATVWIYFTEETDLNLGTSFYTSILRTNPISFKSEFGKGWCIANIDNMWHEGGKDKIQTNRYCLNYFLVLNIGPTDNMQHLPFAHLKDEAPYSKPHWAY